MNMNKLELTDEQLWIVQKALDLYSRVGIGQFWTIKEHPTFENHLIDAFTPKKGIPLEIGDRTVRGEVVEIGKKWIKTKGYWGNGEEVKKWTDVNKIKRSPDYSRYHEVRKAIDSAFIQPRNMLINDPTMPENGSWGIYNESVDDSCRIAFDIIQVIRHERWKKNPERSSATVDSHINFSHTKDGSSNKIKCETNINKDENNKD